MGVRPALLELQKCDGGGLWEELWLIYLFRWHVLAFKTVSKERGKTHTRSCFTLECWPPWGETRMDGFLLEATGDANISWARAFPEIREIYKRL